ncbi:hypothetical protein VPH35_011842 [Triticum aestivum]
MMSSAIAPFPGSGIRVFSSSLVAFMNTALDSFCMFSMEPKFEHTFMVFSNLVRSPADHPRKKDLQPIPQGKGLALELDLELMVMGRRRRVTVREERGWIKDSNGMGTEVLSAVDNKGKQPLHPMPDEVELPPTAKEEPKTPKGGDDEGMEEPSINKCHNYGHYHQEDGPTHFSKVILAPKLECTPMPLDFTKHFVVVPTEFKLRNNTGCSWKVMVKLMNGRVTLDQGWATYTAVHQIKIDYMVTFKLLTPDTLKVIIFDDDGIEVVNKCGKHDEAFAAKE